MVAQHVSERGGDRDAPTAKPRLRLDEQPCLYVVGTLDVEHTRGEVDVAPAQRE